MLALEKQTGEKNPRLASRPKLKPKLYTYLRAYQTLSKSRQFNENGILPIAISEIKAYLDMADIPKGSRQLRYTRFIQALDGVHVTWYYDKQNKNLNKHKNKKG